MSTPRRFAVGRPEEITQPAAMRAALSELVSTFIFVFAGQGSIIALAKIQQSSTPSPSDAEIVGTLMVALAHALSFTVAVAVGLNLSGGHANPAITFGALLGGRITLMRALLYWVAQLFGAIVACLFLLLTTNATRTVVFTVAPGIGEWRALILEMVMTFALVYTVYATSIDPRRGVLGTVSPLAVGFIVGANMLVGGPFDGASMNPALAFGPALVGWRWSHHWIYWAGPLIGAAIAALLYEVAVITPATQVSPRTHQPLPPEDY